LCLVYSCANCLTFVPLDGSKFFTLLLTHDGSFSCSNFKLVGNSVYSKMDGSSIIRTDISFFAGLPSTKRELVYELSEHRLTDLRFTGCIHSILCSKRFVVLVPKHTICITLIDQLTEETSMLQVSITVIVIDSCFIDQQRQTLFLFGTESGQELPNEDHFRLNKLNGRLKHRCYSKALVVAVELDFP